MEVKRYGRWYILGGRKFAVRSVKGGYEVLYEGRHYFVGKVTDFAVRHSKERNEEIRAPMTGRVVAIKVEEGQKVLKGDVLVILEAMKMETTLTAPENAVVREVRAKVGETVQEGSLLLRLDFDRV